jgi:AraC-like DNA-binding protein
MKATDFIDSPCRANERELQMSGWYDRFFLPNMHSPLPPIDSLPTPQPAPTLPLFTRSIPQMALVALQRFGINLDSIHQAAGINPEQMQDELTPDEVQRWLECALEVTGDPHFGLVIGSEIHPEHFGVVGVTAMASPTFGRALEKFSRYKRVVTRDRLELLGTPDGTLARFRIAPACETWIRAKAQVELAFLVSFGRRLSRVVIRPLEVHFQAPSSDEDGRYHDFFGCSVLFSQPYNQVLFDKSDLELPLFGNRELADIAELRAEAMLQKCNESEDIGQRVKSVLRGSLGASVPTFSELAHELHMSERSLQRHLRLKGTSYIRLLDQVRFERARRFLTHDQLAIAEVAYLLGFNATSSFHRAFRRWAGVTPERFRAERVAEQLAELG